MRGIKRLVHDAVGGWAGVQDGGVVHARPLVAARGHVLHAGGEVLRIVLRQADALVLLRIGQARVHGERKGRVVPGDVEGIGLARAPGGLQRPQQAAARGSPQLRRQGLARRCEQVGVLRQRVAGDGRVGRFSRMRDQLGSRSLGLHHTVGPKAAGVLVRQLVADGIHLLAHGVGHHGQRAAHARRLRVPRHGIERRHAHEPHAQRRRDALGRGHGNAHAGERPRPAADDNACQLSARHALLGQQRVDAQKQLGVRGAMRRRLGGSDDLHLEAFRVQHAQADGDDLVGRVERKRVAWPCACWGTVRRAGLRRMRRRELSIAHPQHPAAFIRRDFESFAHTNSSCRARSPNDCARTSRFPSASTVTAISR